MRTSLLILALAAIAIGVNADDCRTTGCTGVVNICLPDFSGATTAFVCVDLTSTCTSCTGVCFAGSCLVCPTAVCGANIGVDASAHAQLALAFTTAFGSSTTISSATSVSLTASATVSADATLTTIAAAASYARSVALTLGVTAAAQSAVVIKAGNSIWVDTISNVATTGAIIIQVGASVNATLVTIATGLTQTVSFQASTASSASVTYTNATYNALTLSANAALIFTGQGLVTFPQTAASVSVDTTATIRVAGGVVVRGVLGTAGFTIGGVTKAAAAVQVKAKDTLTTSGTIAGAASAQLQVYGALSFGGSSVTVSIDVQGSGSTSYGGTTNNGELHITGTSFSHTGTSVSSTGGAIIRIDHPSSSIVFAKFANCSSDSYIYAQVTAVASLSASTTGTVLKFDATTTTRANMKCNVRLYDTTGAYITMVNSNNVAAGRRLLASDGTSNWNADGTVTYTTGSSSGASSLSSSSAITMGAAAALAMIAAL